MFTVTHLFTRMTKVTYLFTSYINIETYLISLNIKIYSDISVHKYTYQPYITHDHMISVYGRLS